MISLEDIATRLDRLESHNAIAELASAYAIACDERDLKRLAGLFTVDAVFDSCNGLMKANGRQAIHDIFIKIFMNRGPALHWTHDKFIRFDDSDPNRAAGQVLSQADTTVDDVVCKAAMKYDDTYRREDGIWRFASRTIHYLYYVPVTEFSNSLNRTERVHLNGIARPADYPENLESWQAYEREFLTSVASITE